jgi:hypothetical protein
VSWKRSEALKRLISQETTKRLISQETGQWFVPVLQYLIQEGKNIRFMKRYD